MIAQYPQFSDISLGFRNALHPLFKGLPEGISEFTFAGIYLFRNTHNYKIAQAENTYILSGKDMGEPFFMCPFQLPANNLLNELFDKFKTFKAVTESQKTHLEEYGFTVLEDRDNFDYLYSRSEFTDFGGRKFHKKRNLFLNFVKHQQWEGKPLLDEYVPHALEVLEQWKAVQQIEADYLSAKEALEKMELLQLCGGIYYVREKPVAWCLGEELGLGKSFVLHFAKALRPDRYKGIYQFLNQNFASILPEKYEYINLEQDLGDTGLRQSKASYNPVGFVKKYKAVKKV